MAIIGFDPGPVTLAELVAMHDAKLVHDYDLVSQLQSRIESTIPNAQSRSPAFFHPFRDSTTGKCLL